jgi:hypothetical protein
MTCLSARLAPEPCVGATGARNGSQRIQTPADLPRPARIVRAGERLSARLRPTTPDLSDIHGMQKVRGSNPLSSTIFFENSFEWIVTISERVF